MASSRLERRTTSPRISWPSSRTGLPPSPRQVAPATGSARCAASAGSARVSSAPRCSRDSPSRTRRSSTRSTRSPATSTAAPKSAELVRHGLRIEVVPHETGTRLDRDAAAEVIVRSLGQLERLPGATLLPVTVTPPKVTAEMLAAASASARLAISRPIVVKAADRSFRVPRQRIAALLALPQDGSSTLAIGGAAADAYFRTLSNVVGRPPRDAGFAVYGDAVQVVPARDGLELERATGGPRDPARRDAPGEPGRAAERRPRDARAHDRGGPRDGHRPPHVLVQDVLLRHGGPDHEPPARRRGARRDARRSRRHLLAEPRDRRAHRSSAASGRLP